jgi:hypothetical protein
MRNDSRVAFPRSGSRERRESSGFFFRLEVFVVRRGEERADESVHMLWLDESRDDGDAPNFRLVETLGTHDTTISWHSSARNSPELRKLIEASPGVFLIEIFSHVALMRGDTKSETFAPRGTEDAARALEMRSIRLRQVP